MKQVAWNVFLEIGGRTYKATVMAETPEEARQKARNGIKISKVAPKDTKGDSTEDKEFAEILGAFGLKPEDLK